MAPVDRAEREARRQQRIRGAGTTSATAGFAFNFDFAPATAKQSSLPPQRTRRTPTPRQQTPRRPGSSAKQRRSVSVHRSSSVRRQTTPKAFVTPQLGKRKRGSKDAQALEEDDGEPDELSADQNNETHSIERPRRVVGTVSPIREEVDDEPDELTVVLEGAASLRKNADEASVKPVISKNTPEQPQPSRNTTPKTNGARTMYIRSRLPARRSKSTEAPPETPSVLPRGSSRTASSTSNVPETPKIVVTEEAEEEDELTPAPASVTPRVLGGQSIAQVASQEDEEIDELSSPAQPAASVPTPVVSEKRIQPSSHQVQPQQTVAKAATERGRPKRIVTGDQNAVQSAPAAKPRQKKARPKAQESADAQDFLDELSPEIDRTRKRVIKDTHKAQPSYRRDEPVDISSAEEESVDAEPEPEDEPTMRMLPAPKEKPVKRVKDQAPRKPRKFAGPKQAISVMRIKGSTVRGITVADTARTVLEENIDHQVQRMAGKMQTAEDSMRRKKLRGHINLALAFKESLVEKLMDLQDANDTLSAGFKKRKLLKKDNLERRKEILTIQNSRHEVALEMDDERAAYDAEKAKAQARSQLSANMFDIQAAIQSGRERARREDREDEGPERPLSLLLDTVGRRVGSVGGGLLSTIQRFNDGLERAAGWLEGRA